MPKTRDELESQGERINALTPVVDTLFEGMSGDFRRGTSTDTKVALKQGRQGVAREAVGRRRKINARLPGDLPPRLHPQFRELVKFLGPAALPLVPWGMIGHFVRAKDALDSLGHMIDHAESAVARSVMLEGYLKQARQLAALAKQCNLSTHSNVMQLAIISELRLEGRGAAGAAAPAPRGEDWRQHALDLTTEDEADEAEGDEP